MRLPKACTSTSSCLLQARTPSSTQRSSLPPSHLKAASGSRTRKCDSVSLSRVPRLMHASEQSRVVSSRRQQQPINPINQRNFHTQWRNRNQNVGPTLRGAGPQDAEEKVHAGPSFETSTMNHFIQAAISGIMPGGEKTSLPLFPAEGMKWLAEPYKDWAPEPFSNLPGPAGPFGSQTAVSPPPLIRMMHIMSGLDNILEDAFSQTPPAMLERSFKVMRTKIWFGMAPMSEAQWKSKGLDEEKSIEEALAIIEQVIDVWKHLCTPKIQGDIRYIHNKLWAEIDVFQDAIAALASSRGEPIAYNFTQLWHEYIKCHFSNMQIQSRSWLYTHLKTLQKVWKDRFVAVMGSGRQISETHGTIRIDHYAMLILNKIQDIYLDADIYVRQRTEGFITADRRIDPRLANIEAPKTQLNAAYAGIFAEMEGKMRGVLAQVMEDRKRERHRVMPTPDFMEAPSLLIDREFCHKSLSYEIDNPIARQTEGWVKAQMDDKVEQFGFVVYRLAYGQSEEQWEGLVKTIEEGINSGWEGVLDGSKIRRKARLHWIDGREEMIAEGNLDGARKDFQTIKDLPSFPANLLKTVCLAITPNSLSSFDPSATTSAEPLPALFEPEPSTSHKESPLAKAGDFRPFLHVIDVSYSPQDSAPPPSSNKTQSKNNRKYPEGYKGTFQILDQLIWSDIFGLSGPGGRVSFEDMWKLSTEHPWGVYVGPTTGVRRREWREMREGMGVLLKTGKEKGGCVQS